MGSKRKREKPEVVGFLGVGLDNKDEHKRITRSEYFFLVGGSEETHGRMQETASKFSEALEFRGKKLQEATLEEIIELFHEAQE